MVSGTEHRDLPCSLRWSMGGWQTLWKKRLEKHLHSVVWPHVFLSSATETMPRELLE